MNRPDAESLSCDIATFRDDIHRHVKYTLGKNWTAATRHDLLQALGMAVRDRLVDRLLATEERYEQADAKRLYYLSMEFLMGRSLSNNLHNLNLYDTCARALEQEGTDLLDLCETEADAALGNGGLGRLAACFLDSLATLDLPGFGYGINYEYGLFRQEIRGGKQVEKPDHWLIRWSPWQIEHPEEAVTIPLYGRVVDGKDRQGNYNPMWLDWQIIIGVPHDMPVVGYGGQTVNWLRLYSARSSDEFDMQIFNEGDYFKAVEQKIATETISKVLYPTDTIESGKELRLVQEYFFVACALRDIVRRHLKSHQDFERLADKVAIQLNDTHPALAVAELMRLLIDENALPWPLAWDICVNTFGYTNHTLLPEALEKWSVPLLEKVLPRHLQIIYEINHRFLDQVASIWPGEDDRLARMSLIEEGATKQVRMAHLAIVGSHAVNGVAALHSELVKKDLVPDFHQLWPERFSNKTNGITQRRWLLKANPKLAELITEAIGPDWITDLHQLRRLTPLAEDGEFRSRLQQVKRGNKERMAELIRQNLYLKVDPESLFDVHIKRIHEYKRQLLNVLHIIHQYLCIVEDGEELSAPRTYIFAGKAAPGYWTAKQIIKLIHNIGQVINHDKRVNGMLKIAFLPDYRVSLAEKIIPSADLSEQISTAGMEASGTGNMKMTLNGALTIGTLDGANVEIREEVGEENIYIFGLRADEVDRHRRERSYDPWQIYREDSQVRRVLDTFRTNLFCPREPRIFSWVFDHLLDHGDAYFLLADLPSYIETQQRAADEFTATETWSRKAALNVAGAGKFSSDRTIDEYAREIWDLKPVPEKRG